MPSILDVSNQIAKFPRDVQKYPLLRVRNVEVILRPGVKQLVFRGTVDSEETNGLKYLATIQFGKVEFSNINTHQEHNQAGTLLGKPIFYPKPSIDKNNAQFKCTCASFRFEFEKQLFDSKSLIGNWRRYKRVTPPSGRPPKNPNNVLGYCKHIHSLINALAKSGRIVE